MDANSDKRADVLLAEFNALRAEIVARVSSQYTIVGLGLTALGVVIGFVVRNGDDRRLLLAVPPLAAVVNLLYAGEAYTIATMGNYIREELWTALQCQVGVLPSWEHHLALRRKGKLNIGKTLIVDGPSVALFPVVSVIAMLLVNHVSTALKVAGWLLTTAAIVIPIWLGAANARDRAAKAPSRSPSA